MRLAEVALVCVFAVPHYVFADGEKLSGTVVDTRESPVGDAMIYFCDQDPRTVIRQELRIQVSPADTAAKNVHLKLPINLDILFETKGDGVRAVFDEFSHRQTAALSVQASYRVRAYGPFACQVVCLNIPGIAFDIEYLVNGVAVKSDVQGHFEISRPHNAGPYLVGFSEKHGIAVHQINDSNEASTTKIELRLHQTPHLTVRNADTLSVAADRLRDYDWNH